MKKYKYFLFDLDGTLTNSESGITGAFIYAMQQLGLPVPEGGAKALGWIIGPPLRDSFRVYVSEERVEEAMQCYRARYEDICVSGNEPYDGIADLLCSLRATGVKLAVATSKPTYFSARIINAFNLEKYFDIVSGCELDGTRSEKADVIRFVVEQLGVVDKSEVLMVGDRNYDVEGAHICGVDAVGVCYGFGDRVELTAAGADYIADTVTDLKALLLSLAV